VVDVCDLALGEKSKTGYKPLHEFQLLKLNEVMSQPISAFQVMQQLQCKYQDFTRIFQVGKLVFFFQK
jgi:hypothetical protein